MRAPKRCAMYFYLFQQQPQLLLLQPLSQQLLQLFPQQLFPQQLFPQPPPQPPQAKRMMRIMIIHRPQFPFPQNMIFDPFSAPDYDEVTQVR